MSAELKYVPVNRVHEHPDNPRLAYREDVVEGIVANLNGEYPQKHAIHVRPIDDGYQILSGHHRVKATKTVGLKEVWAWVEDLDDETAFMELVLSNNQGELSPLEIGIHALQAVPLSEGGRGKKGGLSEYAKRVGKDKSYISLLVSAAEVAKTVDSSQQFIDKAKHLSAIHKAPNHAWGTLVDLMLKNEWTVKDCEHYVKEVNRFAIPDRWALCFLAPDKVIDHYLKTREFSPQTVTKLCNLADIIEQLISTHGVEAETLSDRFHDWLRENQGGDSWDPRKLKEYQREVEVYIETTEKELDSSWQHGNWREFIDAIEDECVSLLLTDPPYGIGFQSDYRLDRRKDRKHENIEGDEGIAELREACKAVHPKLRSDAHIFCFCHWSNEFDVRGTLIEAGYSVRGSAIWVKNNTGMGDPTTTLAPKHERIIHAVKGSPVLYEREADVMFADRVNSERHPTEKPVQLLKRLIEISTVEGEFVADPFGGVASTLVAAKEMGRRYWGCEVKGEYHSTGYERLTST